MPDPTAIYQASPCHHGAGSRKPVTSIPAGGATITGIGSFVHTVRSLPVPVARHCDPLKLCAPLRLVASFSWADTTPVYRTTTSSRTANAVPVKHPELSGPPGVGARATGR